MLQYPDDSGFSPLHFAAKSGDVAIVESLLAAGADASATSSIGSTPMHLAASYAAGKNVLQALHAKGGAVDAVDQEGFTPLILSVYAYGIDKEKSAAQVRWLLANGCEQASACFNAKSKGDGKTAVEIAQTLDTNHLLLASFGLDPHFGEL